MNKILKARTALLRAFASSKLFYQTEGKIYMLLILGFTWLAFSAFAFTAHSKVCCDAVGYGALASSYEANGFIYPHYLSNVRTYLFPFLLYLSHSFLGQMSLVESGKSFVTFSLNTALFLFSVFALNRELRRHSSKAALMVTAGLLLNPLLIQYLPWQLTDSSSTSCGILVCACAVGLTSIHGKRRQLAFLFGSFFAGMAYEIRPANVTVVLAWLIAQGVYLSGVGQSGRKIALQVLLSLTVLVLPMVPQVVGNYLVYNQLKVGPSYDLGSMQLDYGLRYLKYGTDVSDGNGKGLVYQNTFLDTQQSVPRYRYVATFALTSLLHVFNGLNYDYFEPYIQNLDSYRWQPFQIFAQWTNFTGLVFLFYFFRNTFDDVVKRKRLAPLKVFLVSLSILTVLLLSVVAVETRFGLHLTALLGVLSIFAMHKWLNGKDCLHAILLPVVGVSWVVVMRLVSNYLITTQ